MSLVHLEKVVAKKIHDIDGRIAGRLEEINADWRGAECIVTHYVIAARGAYVLRQLGFGKNCGYIVPWDRMDFNDPEKPKLNCRIEELTRVKSE